MTAILVVRHPQTTWNLLGRYQGRLDAPLSEAGLAQSETLSRAVGADRFDAVYSSPLSRARDLAERIAGTSGRSVALDARLTEIGLGPWEGLFRSEIEERFPRLYQEWYRVPQSVCFPSGESASEVQSRALSFMSTVCRAHPGGTVLVVTHSVVIQTLVCASLGLSLSQLHRVRVGNGSVTTFCGEDAPPQLLSMNVTETLYGGAVEAADAQGCATATIRRATA